MRAIRFMRAVSFLGLALFAMFAFGCGGPSSETSQAASTELPEITQDIIFERINGVYIRDVPEENGAAEPINWGFDPSEPKEITVVEQQINGTRGTMVLDIKTGTSPRARNKRTLAGQIRTEWELETGWLLRQWRIVDAENISMKYKNLAPAANSNVAANGNAAASSSEPNRR